MAKLFADPDAIAEDIVRGVGSTLVVGLPLGLARPTHRQRAVPPRRCRPRRLTFLTALTLEKPKPSSELERRFISPVIDRLFGGYPDLDYATALHAGGAAGQHRGDRVLLPRRQMDARARRAAELHFCKLHPRRLLSDDARAQRDYPACRQTRRRRRDALQPELQHRHHAGLFARTQRGSQRVQAGRAGQFGVAVHAGAGRSARRCL